MAKLLILDDQEMRHELFRHKYEGHDITHAWTASQAIHYLSNNEYDYIFLDHDLGNQSYMASGPGTGYEVAEWISKHPELKGSKIIIHSFNPAGASNMDNLLRRNGFGFVKIDPFPCEIHGPVLFK